MTFKIISSAKPWKAIFSALPQFREEASFEVHSNGITFRTMDVSHASSVSLELRSDIFSSFEVDKSQKVNFLAVSMDKIFKRFALDDVVVIENDDETNKLKITKEGTATSFELSQLDNIYDFGFSDEATKLIIEKRFEIELSTLEKMIADSEVFNADDASFESRDGKLLYKGKTDHGTADGVLLERFDDEITGMAFAFSYMKPFISIMKSFAEPTVKAGIEMRKPLVLEFELKDVGIVTYMLGAKMT